MIPQEWSLVRELPALGHLVASNGSMFPDWLAAKTKALRAFWRGVGSSWARRASESQRIHRMDKTVWALLVFHVSRWSMSPALMDQLDRFQRKLVAIVLRLPRRQNEDIHAYITHRGRHAAEGARRAGLWGLRCSARVLSWDEHLLRQRNAWAWAAMLRKWHDSSWLEQRRLAFGTGSVTAGRTGTRARAAGVCARWESGLQLAKMRAMNLGRG